MSDNVIQFRPANRAEKPKPKRGSSGWVALTLGSAVTLFVSGNKSELLPTHRVFPTFEAKA